MSKLELSEHEKHRIIGCLFREALLYKKLSEEYENRNLVGLSKDAWAESLYLMRIREKFRDDLGLYVKERKVV